MATIILKPIFDKVQNTRTFVNDYIAKKENAERLESEEKWGEWSIAYRKAQAAEKAMKMSVKKLAAMFGYEVKAYFNLAYYYVDAFRHIERIADNMKQFVIEQSYGGRYLSIKE